VTGAPRDPRAVVLAATLASLAAAAAPGSRLLLALPAALLLVARSGLDARGWSALLRSVLALSALSFLANAWLVPGTGWGPSELGWARPTREGLAAGAGHGARLACLAAIGVWAAARVEPLDLARSLEWTVRRFPGARWRVHRSVFPAVLAVRILPAFVEEARRLSDVDRLRGGPGGVRAAMRLAPVWLAVVLERADQLGLALTLRGYRPQAVDRGFARAYRLGPGDALLVVVAGAGAVLLLA
jgi:energy-coupling factor transporter transmembrane protein EcfT